MEHDEAITAIENRLEELCYDGFNPEDRRFKQALIYAKNFMRSKREATKIISKAEIRTHFRGEVGRDPCKGELYGATRYVGNHYSCLDDTVRELVSDFCRDNIEV